MKTLFIFICILCSYSFGIAQSNPASSLGKITYLEGKVEIVSGTSVTAAKINTELLDGQTIKTGPKSVAEINWNNGAKTSIEPSVSYTVKELYAKSRNQTVAQTESIFSSFKKTFSNAGATRRAEEGGIRRSQVTQDTVPDGTKLYWKEDQEMTYEDASRYYEKADYTKAIWAFKVFLDQHPVDAMAKYALFALGHSYIMVNNTVKARETFEKFIVKYSNDTLKDQAEQVLTKLPTS